MSPSAPALIVTERTGALRQDADPRDLDVTGHRSAAARAARGGVAARDRKPGDATRSVGGIARVGEVAAGRADGFDVVLAEGSGLSAGERDLLLHHKSMVRPASHPFDTVADLVPKAGPAAGPALPESTR